MNPLLLAAASAGAIAVFLTTDPSQAASAQTRAKATPIVQAETVQPTKMAFNLSSTPLADPRKAKTPAEAPKAQPTAAVPKAKAKDNGSMRRITEVDPQTGEETKIDIIAFNDG